MIKVSPMYYPYQYLESGMSRSRIDIHVMMIKGVNFRTR